MGKPESTPVHTQTDQVKSRRPAPPPVRVSTTLPPPLPRSRAPQATREHLAPTPSDVRPVAPVAPRIPTEAINLAARIEAVADAELAELPPVRVRFSPPSRMPAGTLPPPVPTRRAASPRTTLPPPVPTRLPGPISSATRSAASGSITTPPPVAHPDETVRVPQVDSGEPSVLFTTEAPRRAAVGTFPPPLRTTRAKSPELFMAPPSAATMSSAGLLIEQLERDAHGTSPFAPRTLPPTNAPVAAPFEKRADADEPWFEPTAAVHKRLVDETWVGTLPSGKAEYLALARRLAIPGLVCVAIGVSLGFYVSTGKGKAPHAASHAAAPAEVKAPAMAAENETVLRPRAASVESANAATASAGGEQPEPPTKAEQAATIAAATADGAAITHEAPAQALANLATREVKTAHGTITLADIRIDSDPTGATVTLVDNGAQLPLGSTPLSTSVDLAREYDVIVEVAGRPSQMVHLDPKTTSRLDIALGRQVAQAAPEAAPAAKTESEPTPAPAPKAEPRRTRKAVHADDLERPAPTVAAADASGTGTLMVSTKPPCEIIVDGTPTGLTTPQRSIALAAGRHKITFVNAEAGIKKTVAVKITADQPTKLIQDLMKK